MALRPPGGGGARFPVRVMAASEAPEALEKGAGQGVLRGEDDRERVRRGTKTRNMASGLLKAWGGGWQTMATKLAGYARKAAGLLLIELIVPGGTLIFLTLFLTGGVLPIPERLTAALPILRTFKRS